MTNDLYIDSGYISPVSSTHLNAVAIPAGIDRNRNGTAPQACFERRRSVVLRPFFHAIPLRPHRAGVNPAQ